MFRVMIGAFALLTVVGCGGRDGSSANIPLPGSGGSGGDPGTPSCGIICDSYDPEQLVGVCDLYCSPVLCALEGVEECATDAPECEVCLTRDRYLLQIQNVYEYGYDRGFADGVDSVVCQCPEWPPADVCEEFDDDLPPGHLLKECRGRPDKD